jgi:mannose-6-phosphate isomerase
LSIVNGPLSIILKEGHSTLIPAAIADYDLIPLNGKSRILDAFIDNRPATFARQITSLLHIER